LDIKLKREVTMQAATVVRVINHGDNVQVLCADERGLLSVYFKQIPFISFHNLILKAGLKVPGLQIEFNRRMVRVPVLGKTFYVSSTPRKAFHQFTSKLLTGLKMSLK